MPITIKNKDTLIIDDFIFKCAVGKKGIKTHKKEGDRTTPRRNYSLGKLYYRADRVKKPLTKISTKIIKPKMGWCDDPKSKYYNQEIRINNKIKCEKLFREKNLYDYLIVINYNTKKITSFKGSAIFLHLTKKYKKTEGCIAVSKKDFLIIIKLLKRNSRIHIN